MTADPYHAVDKLVTAGACGCRLESQCRVHSGCGSKATRHTLADAHHIVSSGHPRVQESRRILFDWRIGINDADHGVYLPKKWLPMLQGLEKATAHEMIHSPDYYFEVEARLAVTQFEDTQIRRLTLREIKGEILLDQFVY